MSLRRARALPMRIMDEEFTLYRGDSGKAYLVGNRCAHRGTQLSVGWVEGDCIRCFYHGWKYDGAGQCVEQPAEGQAFAPKVRIPAYPVQRIHRPDLRVFRRGRAAAVAALSKFENADISLDVAGLQTHLQLLQQHRQLARQRPCALRAPAPSRLRCDDHIVLGDPVISVEESEWGVRRYVKYPDGKELTFFFGMPNINFINGQVVDPVIKRADVIVFKVPVDDENHIHFEVRAIPLSGERGRAVDRRTPGAARTGGKDRPELVRAILSGKLRLERRRSQSRRFRHARR